MSSFRAEIAVATGGNSKFEKKRGTQSKITMDLEFYCYNSNLKTIITQKNECLLLQLIILFVGLSVLSDIILIIVFFSVTVESIIKQIIV